MGRIAAILVLTALPALAAAAPPAAPCAALAAGADYVPGIDGAGNAVAPADLPPAPGAATPGHITVKLDPHVTAPYTAGTPAGALFLGKVTVRDGRATLNGAPLDAHANDALIAACRAAKK